MHQTEMPPGHKHKLKRQQDPDKPIAEKQAGAVQTASLLENANDTLGDAKRVVKPRTLLAISIQPQATLRAEIAAGEQPHRDYYALQQKLDADIIFPDDTRATLLGRLIFRFLGAAPAVALEAFRRRHWYDIISSDTEGVGLPLALLLKLSSTRPGHPRHTLIAQHPQAFKKRIFFRLGVGSHLDAIIVHAASLHVFAIEVLHMPSERVLKLPGVVDEHFWRPPASLVTENNAIASIEAKQRPIICAAGLESRDYPTLLTAVRSLDVDVHIAAASAHAFHKAATSQHYHRTSTSFSEVPPNVFVNSYTYAGMRQLYAASNFVVVPVRENIADHGSSVILEAMAMGKAVVVSGTRGQTDLIHDPRNSGRGPVVREWWPGFLDVPGLAETLGCLPTGFYVAPGDPDELRRMIQYLLDHPEIAVELGRNGRRVIDAYFAFDAFIERYVAAILGKPQPKPAGIDL